MFFNVTQDPTSGKTFLSVRGVIVHKGFPALELFLTDNQGNSVFLYTFAPQNEYALLRELGNPDYDEEHFLDIRIQIDAFGNFVNCGCIEGSIASNETAIPAEQCEITMGMFAGEFDNVMVIPSNETTCSWNDYHANKPPSDDCNLGGVQPCEQDPNGTYDHCND